MAKQSNSLKELTPTEGGERIPAPMGGLSEDAANEKVLIILLLSIGHGARKTLI